MGDQCKFLTQIRAAERRNKSLICVGLDPIVERLPPHLLAANGAAQNATKNTIKNQGDKRNGAVLEFCQRIVDATQDLVLAFKPQIAHFAAAQSLDALVDLIRYIHDTTDIPVILDAKRGDIGSTAEMYAREAFEVYNADAVTLNPYMGSDTLQPFLSHQDRGCILLCRTSNPGSEELQNLILDSGERLFERVARLAATQWNEQGNVMLVAGATHPRELGVIRKLVGDMTLLIPGVGAQGADVAELMCNATGGGVIISSSRAILYAGADEDFADAARTKARETRDEVNTELYKIRNDLRH